MLVRDSDLTTAARIRNAALGLFAERGVPRTGIRDVAEAAGVSPGLVQHHFGTKAGLREAVDDYASAVILDTFSDLDSPVSDPIRHYGDRITRAVGEHHSAMLYIARSAAEGDETAMLIFETFVEFSLGRWREMSEEGRLRADVDVEWAALHAVIWPLAATLFAPAISRVLERPFTDPEELERWNQASRMLFGESAYRSRRARR